MFNFFEKRRLHKDLVQMFRLTENFTSQLDIIYRQNNIAQLSVNSGYQELRNALSEPYCKVLHDTLGAVDMTEVYALATFVVCEFYYKYARNEASATVLLNKYVSKVAEEIFNSSSASRIGYSYHIMNELYEKTINGFVEKTSVRYVEFRKVLYSDNPFPADPYSELAKYINNFPATLDDLTRRNTKFLISVAIAQHMSNCIESFKR